MFRSVPLLKAGYRGVLSATIALTEASDWSARMADLTPITAAFFWSKVDIPSNRVDCWKWTSTLNNNGYGRFWDSERECWQLSHRLAYEVLKGEIPDGLQVRHLCHNRLCCNPAHLDVGTARENSEDSAKAGRLVCGSRSPRAKLDEEAVIRIRQNADGLTTRQLAEAFGVSVGTISNVRNGVIWRHV